MKKTKETALEDIALKDEMFRDWVEKIKLELVRNGVDPERLDEYLKNRCGFIFRHLEEAKTQAENGEVEFAYRYYRSALIQEYGLKCYIDGFLNGRES